MFSFCRQMHLRFRVSDQSINLDVDDSWSILFVKQRACLEFNIDSQSHFLAFNNEQLIDWEKVSHYQFPDDALIIVQPYCSKHHFFVLCYTCNDVMPAVVVTQCDACRSPNFEADNPSELSDATRLHGTCANAECSETSGSALFSCSKNPNHAPVIFLKQVIKNLDQITCIACCSNECDVIVIFCPNLGHALCLHCFCSYAESYLSDRRFVMTPDIGYTLTCPLACPDSCISDVHIFRLLGKDFYSRYKEIATKQVCYVDGFSNCPQCDMMWELPTTLTGSTWVFCEKPFGCGAEFCTRCRNLVTPSDDTELSRTLLRCRCYQEQPSAHRSILDVVTSTFPVSSWSGVAISPSDIASLCTIASTCKACPVCKSQTNKNGGCNHIYCVMCASEWCWICSDKWSPKCQANHWF